jgi:hypothetical protein
MTDQADASRRETLAIRGGSLGAVGEIPMRFRLCQSVDEFVARVIYDGRFLAVFTDQPEMVAERLRIDLAPGIPDRLRGQNRQQILAETTSKLKQEYGELKKSTAEAPPVAAAAGVAIVCIVWIAIHALTHPAYTSIVEDPLADQKI